MNIMYSKRIPLVIVLVTGAVFLLQDFLQGLPAILSEASFWRGSPLVAALSFAVWLRFVRPRTSDAFWGTSNPQLLCVTGVVVSVDLIGGNVFPFLTAGQHFFLHLVSIGVIFSAYWSTILEEQSQPDVGHLRMGLAVLVLLCVGLAGCYVAASPLSARFGFLYAVGLLLWWVHAILHTLRDNGPAVNEDDDWRE